jgi:multicomponent Na+:H+ antiporter subunit D
MIDSLPPGALLILGALFLPLLRGRLQAAVFVALPLVSLWHLSGFFGQAGVLVSFQLFDYTLAPVRVDKLSLMFGLIFHVVALLSAVYAAHVRDTTQHVAALVYAGAAIAATFAGDLISLFVFWELTAISSVFLIWASRNEESYRAGLRYLIIHVGSGVLLLAGAIVTVAQTGSIEFSGMRLGSLGSNLIFVAFGIKCAFPLLHNWLQDAYPKATITGTVFLSSFTTKLAIYALARGFEGTTPLIWVGVTMTIFPIFFAVVENDLRKVLSYSLNNQLGFMVVGIGIGGPLAINGAASHAFAHLLYKSLLFMSMGAVLDRTGTCKATKLGGLYKSMPLTTVFCIVGAMSISAFPLFSGFVTKSMVLSAAAEHHMTIVFVLLLFASTGVLEHSGIKIPFFAFFAHDSGIRCKEARPNMLLAMGITAAACIGIGVYPALLKPLLPHAVEYAAYTPTHVLTQLQMLLFAILAFVVLRRLGMYPAELAAINLDSDWVYRRFLPRTISAVTGAVRSVVTPARKMLDRELKRTLSGIYRHHGPEGLLARSWAIGGSVIWVCLLLLVCLIVYYS